MFQTEVIRTSINREDISICVYPIPRGQITTFETLYFLLDNSVDTYQNTITPDRIPKTIVFVDSHTKVAAIAAFFRTALLSKSTTFTHPYSTSNKEGSSVFDIINTFTSRVSQYDRDIRYTKFKDPSSSIRIMVATTSLGMGVNVPDVTRVVNWGFPIDNEPSEIWQRIGRGGRGQGQTSQAFVFLPYWAFDSEGCDRHHPSSQLQGSPILLPQRRSYRNQLPTDRRAIRSRLGVSSTTIDLSDVESVVESVTDSVAESIASDQALDRPLPRQLKHWTKVELASRAALADCWKKICNSSCKREPLLDYLGEGKLPDGVEVIRTPVSKCCNGCNPSLAPTLSLPPESPASVSKPLADSRASIALDMLEKWASTQVNGIYNNPNRRFPMPSSAFISQHCL